MDSELHKASRDRGFEYTFSFTKEGQLHLLLPCFSLDGRFEAQKHITFFESDMLHFVGICNKKTPTYHFLYLMIYNIYIGTEVICSRFPAPLANFRVTHRQLVVGTLRGSNREVVFLVGHWV